jgi:uncharacterized protein
MKEKNRSIAMIIHLSALGGFLLPVVGSILFPLIFWRLSRPGNPWLDHHGREAVNFQLGIALFTAIFILLIFGVVGIPLLVLMILFNVVSIIRAAVAARRGQHCTYPWLIRFIRPGDADASAERLT